MKARESRPHLGEGEKRLNISAGDLDTSSLPSATDDRPRCRRCGHVVFSDISIRVGIGLACRRAVARAAREVAA